MTEDYSEFVKIMPASQPASLSSPAWTESFINGR